MTGQRFLGQEWTSATGRERSLQVVKPKAGQPVQCRRLMGELYLLDEPVNHLDLHQQIAALELFSARVRGDSKAVMMSVHDVNLAARYCDHVLLLFGDGTLTLGQTSTVLNRTSLERLYRHPIVSVAGPQGPAFLPG